MSGLYDRVQRSPRQKTFPRWAVILAIALVVLTCIGLFISRPQRIMNRYEACMDAVSASTIYAKRHQGVRALVDRSCACGRVTPAPYTAVWPLWAWATSPTGCRRGSRMPPSITATPR